MNHPAVEFQSFLVEVERVLTDSVSGRASPESETLWGAARHLCLGGGAKRARPLLVRLFGGACQVADPTRLVNAAVASELVHSASLLHDDVIDAGMFRRGRPTVNARWGNIAAVMTGDLLLSTALGLLVEYPIGVMHHAIETVSEMTRAAMDEVEARGELLMTPERLRRIAEGKTGSLFAWCGQAAALLSADAEAATRFSAFGRRLGVAFQIADDVRDVTGVEDGKPRYADLSSKTPSFPVVIALQRDDTLARRLRDAWAFSTIPPERLAELGSAVLATGAVEQAIAQMHAEIDAGVDALGRYAETPCGALLVGWARKLAEGLTARGAA